MVIQRGDIWWASLPDPVGAMPGYRRPVIILQADSFNQSFINTVIAVVITSNLRLTEAPGNVLLPARKTGLPKDSVANISQVITVDKAIFTEKVGELSLPLVRQIEAGLRLILSL
ncbi:MAG: type II toxin-antitoxin system PemK/MazF family toxin [Chloroflexi bacterium]|nr:type II toxin-antitoxin system PemK/MazF family toxin [Chloroflexota bacterium]